ncbi:hypothetical protein QW180_18000 [Vibrio sinaloensis]|nr:hypothetical protein [Vibrio sinaloensis]
MLLSNEKNGVLSGVSETETFTFFSTSTTGEVTGLLTEKPTQTDDQD